MPCATGTGVGGRGRGKESRLALTGSVFPFLSSFAATVAVEEEADPEAEVGVEGTLLEAVSAAVVADAALPLLLATDAALAAVLATDAALAAVLAFARGWVWYAMRRNVAGVALRSVVSETRFVCVRNSRIDWMLSVYRRSWSKPNSAGA